MKKKKSLDFKVRLGGFLKFFYVTSYIVVVLSGFALIGLFFSFLTGQFLGENIEFSQQQIIIQFIPILITSFLTVILLAKRMKKVKYVFASTQVIVIVNAIINLVKSITDFTNSMQLVYDISGIIIRIVIAGLLIKTYIYYIDNFDRPKQTLIN